MAFRITTTGTQDPVVFNDLGARSFPHPTVDFDLEQEYSAAEIAASVDVSAALAAGEITAEDADGNPINDSENTYVPLSSKGQINGVATLNGSGKVPAAQLPESAGGFKGFGIWRYRTEVTSTPTSGRLNFDDVIVDDATELYVNVINDGGTDVSAFLALLAVDNLIYIQAQDDATQFIVVKIGGTPTLLSGVYTFPIGDVESQGAAMTNNETVAMLGDTGSAGGGVFGNEYQKAESLAQSTTTSSAFQEKLTMNVNVPAGDYIIKWNAEIGNTGEENAVEFRVQLDNSNTLFQIQPQVGREVSGAWSHTAAGHAIVTLSGSHDFDIDYNASVFGGTASIEDARLTLWRVT